ncbi:tetratricopeptide repeat protein [Cyclobacterium plantarum]|nr:tetratricopeptide repeat protein [Cyclobacterium plantarum]
MEILTFPRKKGVLAASRPLIKSYLLAFMLLLSLQVHAQDNVINAFKQSYALEKTGNYKAAAEALQAIYQSDGYEINLRLGWLQFQAGQLEESVNYYQKAVNLKPYAIEPKLGLVLPLSMQGDWNQIIGIY